MPHDGASRARIEQVIGAPASDLADLTMHHRAC